MTKPFKDTRWAGSFKNEETNLYIVIIIYFHKFPQPQKLNGNDKPIWDQLGFFLLASSSSQTFNHHQYSCCQWLRHTCTYETKLIELRYIYYIIVSCSMHHKVCWRRSSYFPVGGEAVFTRRPSCKARGYDPNTFFYYALLFWQHYAVVI